METLYRVRLWRFPSDLAQTPSRTCLWSLPPEFVYGGFFRACPDSLQNSSTGTPARVRLWESVYGNFFQTSSKALLDSLQSSSLETSNRARLYKRSPEHVYKCFLVWFPCRIWRPTFIKIGINILYLTVLIWVYYFRFNMGVLLVLVILISNLAPNRKIHMQHG